MAHTFAQIIDQTITDIVNGCFQDDLSDAGIKNMINKIDPKAIMTFQPALIESEKGEWLVNFTDGSSFKFSQYD